MPPMRFRLRDRATFGPVRVLSIKTLSRAIARLGAPETVAFEPDQNSPARALQTHRSSSPPRARIANGASRAAPGASRLGLRGLEHDRCANGAARRTAVPACSNSRRRCGSSERSHEGVETRREEPMIVGHLVVDANPTAGGHAASGRGPSSHRGPSTRFNGEGWWEIHLQNNKSCSL
jgi:hypothetical protein